MILVLVAVLLFVDISGGFQPAFPKISRLKTALTMKGKVFIATSIDGFIATPDGDVSFLEGQPPSEADGDMGFADFMNSIDVIVMGRKSFEKVISFGQDMWAYGDTKVVVWSRQSIEIPEYRKGTVVLSSLQPAELFQQLEREGYKTAYIDGGLTIQKFLAAGLVEEITLTRVPILLGAGIPLFGADAETVNLQHLDTKAFSNGMVSTKYKVKK